MLMNPLFRSYCLQKSTLTPVASREGTYLLQEGVALIDQLLRLRGIDGLVVELGPFQHGKHLACQRVTLRGDRSKLAFQIQVGAIARIVALDGLRRYLKALQAKLTDRSIDLFEDLGQLRQNLLGIRHRRWQRRG